MRHRSVPSICVCLNNRKGSGVFGKVGEGKDITFKFEGEIICKMPTLVIPAEEKECIGVPDFEGPQV